MPKPSNDIRYKACEVMIDHNKLKSFKDLLDRKCIPKTVLGKDLGINMQRFNRLLKYPRGWTIDEIVRMGELFNVDPEKVFALIVKDMKKVTKKSRP